MALGHHYSKNMNQKIKRDNLTFSISPLPMHNTFRMSVFEAGFPAALGSLIFRVEPNNNLQQAFENEVSRWLIEYAAQSTLQKTLEKFFGLQNLNRNIQYKLYLMAEEDANHKLGLQAVYDEINQLEHINHLMAFLFAQISPEYDAAVALVKNADESDEGDRINKLELLEYFRTAYMNSITGSNIKP